VLVKHEKKRIGEWWFQDLKPPLRSAHHGLCATLCGGLIYHKHRPDGVVYSE
jgi:hypothetical protein